MKKEGGIMTNEEAIKILEDRHIYQADGSEDTFCATVNCAIDMAINALKVEADWKYIETDGNPEEMGTYYCLLVSPQELENGDVIPHYEFDERWFGDAQSPVAAGWIMCGQPDHGLVWTEQCGSRENERVYAWKELPDASGVVVDPAAFSRLLGLERGLK